MVSTRAETDVRCRTAVRCSGQRRGARRLRRLDHGDHRAARGRSAPPAARCTIAVNPWVGYAANVAVVSYLLKQELGCTVVEKDLTEDDSWKGLANGEVDVDPGELGPRRPEEDLHRRQEGRRRAGPDRQQGRHRLVRAAVDGQGAPGHHRLDEPQRSTPTCSAPTKSGGKGQLLGGDPSFVTNDAALIKNLKLDYTVVYAGSEDALIAAFRNGRGEQEAADRLLLHPAVAAVGDQAGPHPAAALHARLRRRPEEGRLRLPAVRPRQDRPQGVRRLGQPGRRPDQELPLDQRRPERRSPATSP